MGVSAKYAQHFNISGQETPNNINMNFYYNNIVFFLNRSTVAMILCFFYFTENVTSIE